MRHINGEEITFTGAEKVDSRQPLESDLQPVNQQPFSPQPINLKPAIQSPDQTSTGQPSPRTSAQEVYRVRFEADTVSLEQDRIRDLFQRYRSLKSLFGEDVSEDLLTDFIDFILYHTALARRKNGAVFVEYFLKIVEGKGPKIFAQFQSCKTKQSPPASPAASPPLYSYFEKVRGKRLMEFMA